jgi:hypothetical protein
MTDSNGTSDKKSSIPLTIENAIHVVAREFNLVPESLRGSVSADGFYITVVSMIGQYSSRFVVATLDHAKLARLGEITASIVEDSILLDMYEMDSEQIYRILFELADLESVKPWIVVRTKEAIRDMATENRSEFWALWEESKLKPAASLSGKDVEKVAPSFSLIKDLQDHVAKFNCGDAISEALIDLCDGGMDVACEILLDQCHFDQTKLADAILQAVVKEESFANKVVAEGLVIWIEK